MNNVKKVVKEYKGEIWTKAIKDAYNKIKKDEITKKKIGHKYIITIPLCDNNMSDKD